MDEETPSELTVLTLNVWGLLFISKQRTERLVEIGRHIARREPVPHIVALQECFVRADYEAIRRETRFALPYGKYYQGGAFGSGLVILSRWPIEESWHIEYPLGGRPTAVTQGDWYVGKGIAGIRTRMGREGEWIDVFNTHTQAPYRGDEHVVHRLSQSWQIAKHVNTATLRPSSLVLALGDFNMKPCSLQHRIVTARAPEMRDTWRVLHPDSSLGSSRDAPERARRRPVPTVEHNILENGCTSNNATNTWRWTAAKRRLLGKKAAESQRETHVPGDALDERGQRLDYVFANVAGAERDGEWEDVVAVQQQQQYPGAELERIKSASSLREREKATEKKLGGGSGGFANGGMIRRGSSATRKGSSAGDKDSGSSSRKRGVRFQDHPVVGDATCDDSSSPVEGTAAAACRPKPVWVIRDARVAVMERHPVLGCSLSDHYGYEVTLVRRTPKRQQSSASEVPPPSAMKKGTRGGEGGGAGNGNGSGRPRCPQTPPDRDTADDDTRGTYLDSPTASEGRESTDFADRHHNNNTSRKNPITSSSSSSSPAVAEEDNSALLTIEYDDLLSQIRAYSASKRREQRYRYAHFWISLLVTAGLPVGMCFFFLFLDPAAADTQEERDDGRTAGVVVGFMLLGMLNFAAGVMDGLYALVSLGREMRCLGEFEWEVVNARDRDGDRGWRLEREEDGVVVVGG